MSMKLCKLAMIKKMKSGYCSESTVQIATDTNISRMALLLLMLLINIGMKLTRPQKVQNEMTQKIQRMEREIKNSVNLISTMQKQIKDLAGILKTIQTNPWPSGSYCILQSGPCPPGFISKSGFMRAIYMFAANGAYMKETRFGDSKIQCHESCTKSSQWLGEIYLCTCCK